MQVKLLPKTLWLASLRYYLKHPWLLLLTLIGLASGVGVVIAIDIAISSTQNQLDKTVSTLQGSATHQIVGGSTGIEQSLFVNLKVLHGIQRLSPVINAYAYSNHHESHWFNILGVEPFNEANFRSFVNSSLPDQNALADFLTIKNAVLLTPQTASRIKVKKGQKFEVFIGERTITLTLVGFLPDDPTLSNLIVTDISNAQVIFDLDTRLTGIDLHIDSPEMYAQISALLPENVHLISTQTQMESLQQLTNAFRTNLRAMSLLALMIGAFVVFTTVRFSVFHRMQQFGLYRVIGITGRELNTLILFEVLVLSIVASIIGLLGGSLLASGLIGLVTQTFSDHYFSMENVSLKLTYLTFIKVFFLGVVVALVTAYLPGRDAAKASPITLGKSMGLENVFTETLNKAAIMGIVVGIIGIVILIFSLSLFFAFAGLFLCILCFALLIPKIFLWLNDNLLKSRWRFFPLAVLMGLRDVRRSFSRTGVAIIAMVIALSATIGVALMVNSFRIAVSDWLDHTMRADVYVSLPDRVANPATSRFTAGQIKQLRNIEGVIGLSRGRHIYVQAEDQQYLLMMVDLPAVGFQGFDMLKSMQGDLFQQFQTEDVVLVTEPFAYHQKKKLGEFIQLNSADGKKSFKIIGIYRDYSSETGKIVMSQAVYEKYWPVIGSTTVGLYLHESVEPDQVVNTLMTQFSQKQNISIRSRQDIREKSLLVFDRTFLITEVLRILILGVALVTVIVSLMSWQLERRRELAIAQAIGFLPRQLQLQLVSQSVFMAFIAFLFSIPIGIFISVVLVYIINQRSFGWGMELVMDASQLFYVGLIAIVAALLAAAYPAREITRVSPQEAMREN